MSSPLRILSASCRDWISSSRWRTSRARLHRALKIQKYKMNRLDIPEVHSELPQFRCIGIEPYVGCALNKHFGVGVAELLLQGPSGGAILTCVKNAPCKLPAVQGVDLLEGDHALVAPGSCGSTRAIPGRGARWLAPKLLLS